MTPVSRSMYDQRKAERLALAEPDRERDGPPRAIATFGGCSEDPSSESAGRSSRLEQSIP
jgi:hypothetical protein